VDVWFVHGSVPGRLMRAIDLLRSSLDDVLAERGIAPLAEEMEPAGQVA
jgi:hypothetical protein